MSTAPVPTPNVVVVDGVTVPIDEHLLGCLNDPHRLERIMTAMPPASPPPLVRGVAHRIDGFPVCPACHAINNPIFPVATTR